MVEPIVTGFGLTTEVAINDPTSTEYFANLTGRGVQQSTIIKVIFLVSIKGFVELGTLTSSFTNFKVRPPGNRYVVYAAIKSNILTARNSD